MDPICYCYRLTKPSLLVDIVLLVLGCKQSSCEGGDTHYGVVKPDMRIVGGTEGTPPEPGAVKRGTIILRNMDLPHF